MPAYVRPLGVLMAIHGVLLGLVDIYLLILFGNLAWMGFADLTGSATEYTIMALLGGLAAGLTTLAAIMQVYGGIAVWRFTGRKLAVIGLLSGLITVFNCYCLPTSLALLVGGLVVLLNPSVRDAFFANEDGIRMDVVMEEFMPDDHRKRGAILLWGVFVTIVLLIALSVGGIGIWLASLDVNW